MKTCTGVSLISAKVEVARGKFQFGQSAGQREYVDRLQFNANSWGGDPYNTARLFAEKTGVYQFSLDYRNIKYFNNIPIFANPLLGKGIYISQQAFDTSQRTMDFQLTFLPGKTVSPSSPIPAIRTLALESRPFPVTEMNSRSQSTSGQFRLLSRWSNIELFPFQHSF